MKDEPDGTRMQVVEGFSELNFNFLVPLLLQEHKRHSLDTYFPEWSGDHWRCSYHLDDGIAPGVMLIGIVVFPNGNVVINLLAPWYDAIKHPTTQLTRTFDKCTPYKIFLAIGETFAGPIAKHLNRWTKKSVD